MSSVNKAILVGNLGNTPEIKAMHSGERVANLSIATSETWRDKQTGERKEKTEWHRVTVFNKYLVALCEKLDKGAKLYVEGSLQTRKWTDQQGQERFSTEVVLSSFRGDITVLEWPKREVSDYEEPAGVTPSQNVVHVLDDEIPF